MGNHLSPCASGIIRVRLLLTCGGAYCDSDNACHRTCVLNSRFAIIIVGMLACGSFEHS